MARKKASLVSVEEESSENEPVVEKKATKASKATKAKKVSTKTKKKSIAESPEGTIDLLVSGDNNASIVEGSSSSSDDSSKKKTRKTKKKGNLFIFVSML
jgi:hypothetical protein